LNKEHDKDFAYSLGWDIGENLQSHGIEALDADSFSKGLSDRLKGMDPSIPEDAMKAIIQSGLNKIQQKGTEQSMKSGVEFLESNAKREGVKVTDSGLQYEVITAGTGPKPGPKDQVTTHYHGTLIDGSVFDSSVQRGEPATFPVNGVIAGWIEALQMMNQGSKWRLFIPPDLAYGGQAAGSIAPWSTLVFEVELLQVHN